MFEKANSGRDAFTFSLGGMTTIASHHAVTAIADDQINKAWDERLGRHQEDQPDTAREIATLPGRFWLLRRFRRAA